MKWSWLLNSARAAVGLVWAAAASLGHASVEAGTVISGFGPLEWIGGKNEEESNNTSGWLPTFEGREATSVNFSEPHSAMGDLSGNVLIADKNAHAIRLIDPTGRVRTVAGTNVGGFNGDGPALSRHLNGPQHAYPMPDGSFYILDTWNQRIRRVDAAGQMTTVIVENTGLSRGLWVKRDGSLIYYCTNTALKRWTPSLGQNPGVIMAQNFSELGNIDVAENGDIFLTDRGLLTTDPTFSKVFRIIPSATPSTYTPVVVAGTGGTADSGPASSGSLALNIGIRGVRGIAFHPAGGYFLATHKGGDLWYVDRAGIITMIVQGNDGNGDSSTQLPRMLPATNSNTLVSELRSVSVALNGDLLIAAGDSGFILRARYIGPRPVPAALRVLPPNLAEGPVRVEWTPAAGRWFRLESCHDPALLSWTVRLTSEAPTDSYPILWQESIPSATQARQFYRLREFRNWPN